MFLVLPGLGLNSQSSGKTSENIAYFSSDGDDDDVNRHTRENNEDDSNNERSRSESPEETPPVKRRKLDHEEDEEENSNNNNNNNNSDSDSDLESESDSDDLEKADVKEVNNHNAPEEVINDLDTLDKARRGDPEALDEIKREYSEFFRENSDEEGLKQVEEYLDSEFEPEHIISELEADALEQEANAEGDRSNNSNNDGSDNGNNSSGGTGPSGPSGGTGPSGSSGSDPGPSDSSGGGGNFSKILIILGIILETIAKVLEDLGNFL